MKIDIEGTGARITALEHHLDNYSYSELKDQPVITDEEVIIDTAMSGESMNMVQNKVIKAYVDTAKQDYQRSLELGAVDLLTIDNKFIGYVDGQPAAGGDFACSDFIKLNGIVAVSARNVVTGLPMLDIAFYDTDKNFISGVRGNSTKHNLLVESNDIPADAAYIRLTHKVADAAVYAVTLFAQPGKAFYDAYGLISKLDDNFASFVSVVMPIATTGESYKYSSKIYLEPYTTYRIIPSRTDFATQAHETQYKYGIYGVDSANLRTPIVRWPRDAQVPAFYDLYVDGSYSYYQIGHRNDDAFTVVIIKKDALGAGGGYGTGILDLNPKSEWLPKMLSAKKTYYTTTTPDVPKPVVIAHISDIHANWANVSRYLEFCNEYRDFIDLSLNTGDTVSNEFSDGIAGYEDITGVEGIVNLVGNHDTRVKTPNDWDAYANTREAYERYYAHVDNWEVVQPIGAGEGDYFPCYSYKDYDSQKLRIIFVDVMGYNVTQNTWVAGVLADAKINGYHVLIAAHSAGFMEHGTDTNYTKVDCNYSTLYGVSAAASGENTYNAYAWHMIETVDDFIADDGVFIGYLVGHSHRDFIAKKGTDGKQWIYAVGASIAGEVRDYAHTIGTREQDEFQIVSIDTYGHNIKLFKVGANVDRFGRHINSICIDYLNKQIVCEGY